MAGSRSALAAALPGIARGYGAPSADVIVWPSDAEWRSQALARGWTWSVVGFTGTLGIIDPKRFLAGVRPLIEERSGEALQLEAEGEGARLRAAGETVLLETVGHLTALVFGEPTE